MIQHGHEQALWELTRHSCEEVLEPVQISEVPDMETTSRGDPPVFVQNCRAFTDVE
jgi:hypothetical protein